MKETTTTRKERNEEEESERTTTGKKGEESGSNVCKRILNQTQLDERSSPSLSLSSALALLLFLSLLYLLFAATRYSKTHFASVAGVHKNKQ